MPALRDAILDGSFHRAVCPQCGKTFNVESVFYYTDLARQTLFLVLPRSRRHGYKAHGDILRRGAQTFPKPLFDAGKGRLRLVYGLSELRDKLVAQDAQYDDDALEYLKARLLAAHPVLTQRNRVQLSLHQTTRGRVTFVAYHHHHPELYELSLPRSAADRAMADIATWKRSGARASRTGTSKKARRSPAAKKIALDDFWVSFRNWSARYSSLDVLHDLAEDVRAGKNPPLAGPDFDKLLKRLPRGKDLSGQAKGDLTMLFDHARKLGNEAVERKLLEIRFGPDVSNEWAQNADHKDIPLLWDVLRALPASNVEENTDFKSILLTDVSGGVYDSDGTIEIGTDELSDPVELQSTLRHEVGHAVNEHLHTKIDPWLAKTFGWKMYPAGDAGNEAWANAVAQWAKAMGGWGPASAQERKQIAQFLQDCLVQSSEHAEKSDSWDPVLSPTFPADHAWHSKSCLPAEAYRRSGGGDWYSHCATWLAAGGKRFAVNFYYGQLMEMNAAAIDDYVLKEKRSDHYGAMSMAEFFAELYALYFDPKEHPEGIIDKPVLKWMRDQIGPMAPSNPARGRGVERAATARGRKSPQARRKRR